MVDPGRDELDEDGTAVSAGLLEEVVEPCEIEQARRRDVSGGSAIAAPRPIARLGAEPCANRVQHGVSHELPESFVSLGQR